jgi:glucuronate isomerase
VFGIDERPTSESADRAFDRINECLAQPVFRPRALFERFNIEVLATTESPLDPLAHHQKIRGSGWKGRVITAYRPDPVVDPEFDGFRDNVGRLAAITAENTATWRGYLAAHRNRRAYQDTRRDVDRPRSSHGPNLRSRQCGMSTVARSGAVRDRDHR